MSDPTQCPKCQSVNIYQDGNLWICPECSNEWVPAVAAESTAEVIDDGLIRDANGNVLADGDNVIVLKDLNIKGSSSVVKGGTKVRNIRLRDMGDGHDILCKIDGLGAINLKSSFVKKV
ncbi:PhnA protein [Bdellovibrio sp. qaytius]|nr:PhnA protein [Bdellovibrio sp. qaytius]